jgi:cellobiose transport system substrate-binding protein
VAANGAVLGLPTDVGGLVVCYRKDLFARAGLPSDRDKVATLWPGWDAFAAVGQRYATAVKDPKLRFVDDAGSVFHAVLERGGERFYDRAGRPSYATNPLVRRAWDVAGRLSQQKQSLADLEKKIGG